MTRGSDTKPVRRLLRDYDGSEYVVELRESSIHVRPKGSRAEAAKVTVTAGGIYNRVLMSRALAEKPKRAVRIKRGLL